MADHVVVGTGSSGSRFLISKWPIDEGLTLGTTKLSDDPYLEAEIDLVDSNDKVGL